MMIVMVIIMKIMKVMLMMIKHIFVHLPDNYHNTSKTFYIGCKNLRSVIK